MFLGGKTLHDSRNGSMRRSKDILLFDIQAGAGLEFGARSPIVNTYLTTMTAALQGSGDSKLGVVLDTGWFWRPSGFLSGSLR